MSKKTLGRLFFLLVISALALAACGGTPAESGEVDCKQQMRLLKPKVLIRFQRRSKGATM